MTRGAVENRKLAQSERESKRNAQIEKDKLADKEKQRSFDRQEKRKDRINKLFTSGLGLLKFPKFNEPSWYKRFIPDLDRYTNISTYQRLGSESFPHKALLCRTDAGGQAQDYANPGIMVIPFIPTTGPQNSAISTAQNYPMNQALNRTKEQVLKSNSRSSVNWEGSDVGLNIFCTCDIFVGLVELKKALIIYQTYKGDNSYLANAYLRALGWDFSDIAANAAQYRKDLLVLAAKFNSSIVAPADISLYHRRAYLAGNIFADRKGTPKQVYMFKQLHYHRLNATGDGTTIYDRPMLGGLQTLSTFITWLNSMIESITANPDYVEMYADLRASVSNLLTFDGEIKPDDTIEFNSDDLNREQIHNIKTLPWMYEGYATAPQYNVLDWSLHINSDGYLFQGNSNATTKRNVYYPMTSYTTDQVDAFKSYLQLMFSHNSPKMPTLLDMDKDEINGDDILEITRGIYTGYQSTSTSGTTLEIYSCGTELFYGMYAVSFNYGTSSYVLNGFGTYNSGFRSTTNPMFNTVNSTMYSKFDWAPMYHLFKLNDAVHTPVTDDNLISVSANLTDLNHCFTISTKDADALNEACVLSELYLVTDQFRR